MEDFFTVYDMRSSKRNLKCDTTTLAVTKALENMASAGLRMDHPEDTTRDIVSRRQCFGREICLRMVEDRQKKNNVDNKGHFESIIKRAVYEFETLIILYHQLSDYSIEFTEFLKDIRYDEAPENSLSCFDLFPNCN